MSDAYVDQLCYALGEIKRDLGETVAAGGTFSGERELHEAGFRCHRVCGPETTAYDLARRAVEGIADRVGVIDAIIYSTCIPLNGNVGDAAAFERSRDVKHLMQYPASRLQADFGLDRAIVIGLNQQACTGMLGSLRLARSLLHSEPDFQRILCVTADRFPQGAVYEQAYNLISDGAAGCVVSRRPGRFRLLAAHQTTNGAMVETSDDQVVGSYFSYTHGAIMRTLDRAGLTPAEIDWVVPQNTNVKAWQIMARLLRVDPGRVYFPSMAEAAHVISGDNIINLRSLAGDEALQPGHKILLVMAGYGMNWQCTILEATETDRTSPP